MCECVYVCVNVCGVWGVCVCVCVCICVCGVCGVCVCVCVCKPNDSPNNSSVPSIVT